MALKACFSFLILKEDRFEAINDNFHLSCIQVFFSKLNKEARNMCSNSIILAISSKNDMSLVFVSKNNDLRIFPIIILLIYVKIITKCTCTFYIIRESFGISDFVMSSFKSL